MSTDAHMVGQLLLKLAEEGKREGKPKEIEFRTRLQGRLQMSSWAPNPYDVKREKLQDRFGRTCVNLFKEKTSSTYIPLKPVVKSDSILPFLSVVANRTLSNFRLLLLAFREDAQNGSLKSVGLRFESPEGEGGKHNYWHVQLTSSFVLNGGQVHPSTPSWLPSSTPAIPLDASSAPSCVVALAVALYGGSMATDLVESLRPSVSVTGVQRLTKEVRALGK